MVARHGHSVTVSTARTLRAQAVAALVLAVALAAGGSARALPLQPPSIEVIQAATPLIPVAVFGKDDRTKVPDRYAAAARGVGFFFNDGSRTICSAFCVAPAMIATAAHCLFHDRASDDPPLREFRFTLDRKGGRMASAIAGADDGTAAENVMTGAMRLNLRPPIDAASDWAVVRLASPICDGAVLPVAPVRRDAIEAKSRSGGIFELSYHSDWGDWQQAFSGPCEVRGSFKELTPARIREEFANPDALILHRCDTGEASSGSPLLADGPQGPAVIGINVGTYVQSKVLLRDGRVAKTFKPVTVANTGVNAQVFAAGLEVFADAEVLGAREDIAIIQARLRALSLYAGPTNGRFGELTRAAIKAFERSRQMPETGLPTLELARRLIGAPPVPERKPAEREAMVNAGG